MTELRDEFLSEEDLDLRNLTHAELILYWNLWLAQAQVSSDRDEGLYSHGVFAVGTLPEPMPDRRPLEAPPGQRGCE